MVTVTHHTSHSFSYLSSLPLVTDPVAVASNDCAIDHLHKDCCAQAFGRNTLSKPHIVRMAMYAIWSHQFTCCLSAFHEWHFRWPSWQLHYSLPGWHPDLFRRWNLTRTTCPRCPRWLRQHSLFAQEDKCLFHTTSVKYLGYMLSPEGLTMADNKVKCIQDWPEPRKVHDIQSFLSFANFYQRFVDGYSAITVPLTRLMRKGLPWNFTQECREAFNKLKLAFTFTP